MIAHLNLQRRHGANCKAKHPRHSLTTEADEHKRGASRCDCLIYASGTLGGESRKLGTRERDWDKARAVVAPFLTANSWTLLPAAPPPPPPPTAKEGKPALTVKEGVQQFLAQHQAEKSSKATIKKYRLHLLGRLDGKPSNNATLLQFATDHGITLLSDFDDRKDLVRELMQSWSLGKSSTVGNRLGTLKTFFEFFIEDRNVLDENPARIRRRRNRANRTGQGNDDQPYLKVTEDEQDRVSYSDAEIRQMLEGCLTYGKVERRWPKKKNGRQVVAINGYRDYPQTKWDGEDLAAFIEISYCTGMRIIDVATFHESRLRPDGTVRVRALKNDNWVCVWVDEAIQEMIRDRARRYGPYIFGDPTGREHDNITQVWRRRLEALWEQTGPYERNPIHHRFRHTFVRMLLQNRTPPRIVADLIGDTEETVRRHYSNYCVELQEVVTSATQSAMRNRPRFQAIAS